jgi:fused signal recognition particle receptor
MMAGLQGAGKTTTVAKLAGKLKSKGKKPLLVACDVYRPAAITQLQVNGEKQGVEVFSMGDKQNPVDIAKAAIEHAKSNQQNVVLIDTAGRLHNKKNLMEELKKINRVIDREYSEAYRETLVVLDATTGQNALAQAREFNEVADITGVILTKMDGTAKGGIAVAIQSELGIPVKYIGVGETIEDLQKFDSNEFVNALFDIKDQAEQ